MRFGVDGRPVGAGWRYREPDRPINGFDFAWNGTGFGLVWCGQSPDGPLTFLELDADGKPVSEPRDVVLGAGSCLPVLLWDGGGYGLFWLPATESGVAPRTLSFTRLDRWGRAIGGATEVLRGAAIDFAWGATSGNTHVVVFLDRCGGAGCPEGDCPSLYYVVTTASGEVLVASTRVSYACDVTVPHVAFGEGLFGIVFQYRTSVPDIELAGTPFLALVAADSGRLIDAPRAIGGCEELRIGAPAGDCRPAQSLAVGFGLGGWALAVADLGGGTMNLLRLDRFGVTTDVAVATAPAGYSWEALNTAFDGEGFGVLSAAGIRPLFARFLLGP
jgi:hypothetical protein